MLFRSIDMQNDFINGELGTKEAEAIVPFVKDKIKEYREAERDTASRIQNVPIRHHHPENHRQEEQVHCDYSGPKALRVVHLEVVEQNIRHTSKARFRMQGIWKTVQAKWRQDRMWKKSKKRHCRK